MSGAFQDRSVLVTGAGSGIGKTICLTFAREGATVIAAGLSESGTADTQKLITQGGGKAYCLEVDIASPDAVSAMFAEAFGLVGTLDYAVNNAGVSQLPGLTGDIEFTEWSRVVAINLTGTWLCMKEELAHMVVNKRGAIVNIASMAALRTLEGQSAYVASKHGVAGLTRNAAVEYAEAGIRINAVCPGTVPTAMFERHIAALSQDAREEAMAAAGRRHPMGRVGTPQEIADMALFLCSDKSSFVTGQCIAVDGGRTAA